MHFVLAALSLFAQAFSGSWHCVGTTRTPQGRIITFSSQWSIRPAPGKNWTVVQWGIPGRYGGTAYVGYVDARKEWLYEDFHGDGSFAESHSSGPVRGAWTWYGRYYRGDTAQTGGPITWQRVSPSRIERTYARSVNGTVVKTGSDSCTALRP